MAVDSIGSSNTQYGTDLLSLISFFPGKTTVNALGPPCIIFFKCRFLWIMGVSLTVSLHNKLRHAVPRRHLIFHILQRSLILILFGIVLNSHGNPATLDKLRIPGVLQRIGVTYLIVGLLEAGFTKRTEAVNEVCWANIIIVLILLCYCF